MMSTGAMAFSTIAGLLTLAAFSQRTTVMTETGSAVTVPTPPALKKNGLAKIMMAHVTSMLTTEMAYSTGAQILNLIRSAAFIQQPAKTQRESAVTPTPPVLQMNMLAIIDND